MEKVVEKPIVISTQAEGEAEKSKQVKKTSASKKTPAPSIPYRHFCLFYFDLCAVSAGIAAYVFEVLVFHFE